MEGGVAYHFSVSLPPGVRLVSPGLVFILRERGFVFPLQLNGPFFVPFQEVTQKITEQLQQQQQQATEVSLSHRGLPEKEVGGHRDLR